MKKKSLSLAVSVLLAAALLILSTLAAVGSVRWAADGAGIRTTSTGRGESPHLLQRQ